MPRANRHYIPGYVWHITHRGHKKEFLLKRLTTWNSNQTNPVKDFKPENIINKHGVAKIERLIDKYSQDDNGFSRFINNLNT